MAKKPTVEMEWSIYSDSYGFAEMIRNLWSHRELIRKLTVREIQQRYQGLYLGTVWSIITPIIMLIIYTFVFSVVLKVRWAANGQSTPPGHFAIILFAALIPFNMFIEVLTASPRLILGVPNLVKRTRFPLEVLSIVRLMAAFVHSIIYQVILLVFEYILLHSIPTTALLLPLAYIPLLLLALGMSWILSSIGVYIRDIAPVVEVGVRILFFITPIFYPPSLVPPAFHIILYLNPLTFIVECFRRILVWNMGLRWDMWGLVTLTTLLFAWLAYIVFIKLRKGFAEVM